MTLQEIQQKIEEFKGKADDDFKIYTNSFISALKAVRESPSTANVKEYEKANRAIEEYLKKKEAEASNEIRFQNILDVSGYLQSVGWKISKSKLYADRGIIKTQADGAYLKKDVDKYAEQFLRKLDASDIDSDSLEKLKEETRLTKERADKVAFENEIMRGSYVLKEDVEQQLAARASFIKSSIEGFFHSLSPRIAEIIGGDISKIPELTEFCLRETEDFFHHYSKPLTFEAVKPVLEGFNQGGTE